MSDIFPYIVLAALIVNILILRYIIVRIHELSDLVQEQRALKTINDIRNDLPVIERTLQDAMKQLMSFHKAGNMLADSEVRIAQVDADNKRAETDRLLAETRNIEAQRRETEANTPPDGVALKPGAPPKFGEQGRHRVGETAYTNPGTDT